MPSKHPMPLNTLSNTLCIFHVSSVLSLLSISMFGHDRKWFVSLFALVLSADPQLLLVLLKLPSVFVQHCPAPWVSCLTLEILASSMFMLQFSLYVSSASKESMFTLIMLSAGISDMPNSVWSFPRTTKKFTFPPIIFIFYCHHTCPSLGYECFVVCL